MYMDITTYSSIVEEVKAPNVIDPEHLKFMSNTGLCEQEDYIQPAPGF